MVLAYRAIALICVVLLAFSVARVEAADKFKTIARLELFGVNQLSHPGCNLTGSVASTRIALIDSYAVRSDSLAIEERANALKYSFVSARRPPSIFDPAERPGIPVEAWRTYLRLAPGTWDFVAVQKLSSGERLSDAIRYAGEPNCQSNYVTAAEISAGDMQVSTVGAPFAIPTVTVTASVATAGIGAVGISTALASEAIEDEALDTGIDGPKTALLTNPSGNAHFDIIAGTRPGVKRFIVKARGTGLVKNTASAMVTLIHAPIGAPVANSVPIVEYVYNDGAGLMRRFLTGAASVTRLLDSHDEANLFKRTGQVWRAFTQPDAAPGLAPVCQFFGLVAGGPGVSHFFTADARECATLRALWGDAGSAGPGLKYEGIAFYAVVPDAQGRCPSAFPLAINRYFDTRYSTGTHLYQLANQTPQSLPPLDRSRFYGPPERVAFCTDVATSFDVAFAQ
jgi:hypothetical protein